MSRAGLHALLLRMAGRLPDELVHQARGWLAAGDEEAVREAVAFAVLSAGMPVLPDDAALLGSFPADAFTLDPFEPYLGYRFAPVAPALLEEVVPYSLDLSVPYDGPGAPDEIDTALVAHCAPPLEAVWRTWRFPDASWPAPRRVYLARTTGDPVAAAASLAAALEAAGETDPQVEAWDDALELPLYQRTALNFAALLWSARPATAISVARLYDEPGPSFALGHPLLASGERERVLRYLEAGAPLVLTAEFAVDVVEPPRGAVVPVAFRTDGAWIWSEGAAYYVAEYGLAPDPGLLAHIEAAGDEPAAVDDVTFHRALSRLYATTTDAVDHG